MGRSGSHGPDEALGGSGGRGVLLLAIAVVLGIVILQATDNSGGKATDVTSGTEVQESTSTTASPATTTRPLRMPAEVKVLPANGTQLSGLGSRVGDLLKGGGYTNTLSAVDATTNNVDATIVQYTTDFGPEAQVVAVILGLPATVVKPLDNPPVRDTRGADVIVVAGKDLERLASTGTSAGATTTTAG